MTFSVRRGDLFFFLLFLFLFLFFVALSTIRTAPSAVKCHHRGQLAPA